MLLIRLIANGMMYYLVEIDESLSFGLLTVWALPGNKIQTYVNEQSAIRALERIQEYPKETLGFMLWDDSDAEITKEKGEVYRAPGIRSSHYEFHIVDADMKIARQWKIDYLQ